MILSGVTNSFKLECQLAIHAMSADAIMAALYTSSADLHAGTAAYSTTNEATGTNWPAGGYQLTAASGYPRLSPYGDTTQSRPVLWAFDDRIVGNVTITFRAILLYNASKSNRSIAVIDKGVDVVVLAGPITLFTNPAAPYLIMCA